MKRMFFVLTLVIGLSATAKAESIENPVYTSWSKYKPGTVLTMKSTSEFGGQKNISTMISALKEITADTISIKLVVVISAGGMEIKTPPQKIEVKKMTELPPGKTKADYDKPEGVLDQGTETVKIDGVDYKSKWTKMKIDSNGTVTESKAWTSADIPGMVVKSESKSIIMGMTSTSTMEVMSVKKP